MEPDNKTSLDGIDKEILRALSLKSPLVSRKIAKIVGLTPSAISYRLENLKKLGMLKKTSGTKRVFTREFNDQKIKIKSPNKILWELDLIDK